MTTAQMTTASSTAIMKKTRIKTMTRTSTTRVGMTTVRFTAVLGLVLLLQGLLPVVVVLQVQAVRRDPLSSSFMVDRLLLEEKEEGTTTTTSSNRLLKKNVNVPIPKSPDDHLVTDMPLLKNIDFKNTKHWSGLLPVNEKGDGYLFYWLFEPDPDAIQKAKSSGLINDETKDIPLVIWLNGGPACSSMDGLWVENGPFRLRPGGGKGDDWNNIEIDPYSWHTAPAYTLYIDQPVGTGLSFTTSFNYPSDDEKVNIDFYYFLTEFMKLHSDKFTDTEVGKTTTLQRPLYFSGESHAGHYIPSMMNYIRKKNIDIKKKPNKKNNQDSIIMPLTGALIGNGWFDPIYQYSAHEAAYGYGLIGKGQERALAKKEETCRTDLKAGTYTSRTCFSLLDDVISNSLGNGGGAPYKVSQYDQRKWESKRGGSREFPPGHKDVEAYLGQTEQISNAPIKDVLNAIHAMPSWESGQRYRECTDPPYNALSHQDGLGVTQDIIELLNDTDEDDKIQLLFFNGVHDLICNHVGNENALENLEWNYQNEYQTASRYGWKSSSIDKLGGYIKEYENLYFLKVLNSGHMVPMDVPGVALDMLETFIYKQSFQTYKQDLNAVKPLESESGGGGSSSSSSCPKCPAQEKCDDDDDDDDDDDVKVECPVCDDNGNGNSCTKTQCKDKYDFTTSSSNNASTSQNTSSSPIVQYVVGGVAVFVTIAGLACFVWSIWSCFCRRTDGSGMKKYGAVELSSTMQQNGGFSDHDDGENGFSDEDNDSDSIRRRGALA